MSKPLTTFILSYERPIYLWATLDSLYRSTKSSMRFVLIDSGSRDPLVHDVIDGFARRNMFDEVLRLEQNNSDWFVPFFSEQLKDIGEIFFSVDGDVIVESGETCWAQRMLSVMKANPKLAMLGSKIDKTDFVDPAVIEARLGRKLITEEEKQIKLMSPERNMLEIGPDEVQSPFNPPGRLLALRTDALQANITTWEQSSDYQMHVILRKNGWETGIYGGVIHRHLSLCNYFDYPLYSMENRDLYMKS